MTGSQKPQTDSSFKALYTSTLEREECPPSLPLRVTQHFWKQHTDHRSGEARSEWSVYCAESTGDRRNAQPEPSKGGGDGR